MSTPEGAVVRSCLDYPALRGIFAYRQNTGAAKTESGSYIHFGLVGASDIVGVLPGGRFLAVECKAGRGKTTLDQEQYLARVREAGGCAIVARSVDDLIKEGL